MGGTIKTADRKKNAPGNVSEVAVYKRVYTGALMRGTSESRLPMKELTFPVSLPCTVLEIIDRGTCIMEPENSATTGARVRTETNN